MRQNDGWGHGTYDSAIKLAAAAHAKKLFLTHHEPERTDAELDDIYEICWKNIRHSAVELLFAQEGTEISSLIVLGAAKQSSSASCTSSMPVFFNARKQLYRQRAMLTSFKLFLTCSKVFLRGAVSQLIGFGQQDMQRQIRLLAPFDHLPIEFSQGVTDVHDQDNAA